MAILFDLDDTLIDDAAAREASVAGLFAHHRAALPCDEAGFHAAWRQAGDRNYVRHLRRELSFVGLRRVRVKEVFARRDMTDAQADEIIAQYMSLYDASLRLFPDVLPVLEAMRGLALGVVTNGHYETQVRKLRHTGLLDRFAVVTVSEAVGCAKPEPEIFRHAQGQLGCSLRDCVFIGDDWDRDIEGARRSGITPIWLTRQPRQAGAAPSWVLNISSLLELLERSDLRSMLGLEMGS